MLITFSGMVGSGKTVNAKNALRWLNELGYQPHYVRFRFIGWRSLLRSPSPKPWQKVEREPDSRKNRARDESRPVRSPKVDRTMSFFVFLGYMIRILRFRLFLFLHHRGDLVVINRYFYDSLAQFRFSNPSAKRYRAWLLAAVPKPDLAFLLRVRPEVAKRRRPAYDFKALRQLADNYYQLRQAISGLCPVATDDVKTVDAQVKAQIASSFGMHATRTHEKQRHS